MRKIQLLITASFAVILLAQCSPKTGGAVTSSGTSNTEAAKSSVAFDKTKYPDEVRDLGKTTWKQKCGKCHKLYDPTERSADKWEKIIPRMAKKASLEPKEEEALRVFILSSIS
jgi:hypothetical protein